MSQQHTPEPWGINEWPQPDASIAIGAIGTPLIARVILRDVSINEQKANARRIVACVNACAQITTDELESIPPTGGMLGPRDDVARIAKQRDELLSALMGMCGAMQKAMPHLPADHEAIYCGEWFAGAQDIIARVKGERVADACKSIGGAA